MELRFFISGSLVCTRQADSVPPVGALVTIRTESYKKGVTAGSLIRFPISEESPPEYDYSDNGLVVFIDVNGWEVLEAGLPVAKSS